MSTKLINFLTSISFNLRAILNNNFKFDQIKSNNNFNCLKMITLLENTLLTKFMRDLLDYVLIDQ